MQGDAIRKPSDAKSAVFVWGVFLFIYFYFLIALCQDAVTSLALSQELVICEWGGVCKCERSHVRGPSIRCQSGSSPHLFISMTEQPSCQSS